jgi:micrococcal nuclease
VRPERLIALLVVLALTATVAIAVWLLTEPADGPPPVASGPPAAAEAATVVHVIDGDTIVITIGGREERVRYIGIDAPELARVAEGVPAECGAETARDANAAMVTGRDVRLERDESDRDRFGRLLRHVWVEADGEWVLVAAQLVRDGAVEARSYPPDGGRDGQLDAAERQARQAGVGMWATC